MKLSKFELLLLIIPILAAIVILPFLPGTIPVHWNDGVVDGFGSKYLILILALLPYITYRSFRRRFWP